MDREEKLKEVEAMYLKPCPLWEYDHSNWLIKELKKAWKSEAAYRNGIEVAIEDIYIEGLMGDCSEILSILQDTIKLADEVTDD